MDHGNNPALQEVAAAISRQELCALILAGGAGRRLQGRDKGLESFRGRPLVEYLVEYFEPRCSTLLISCNRNLDRYRKLGYPLVQDIRPGFQGPLAGLEAAAPLIETPFVVVSACDTPDLPPRLIERLAAPFGEPDGAGLEVCFAHDGQRAHYLCAIVRTRCLPGLTDFLDRGERAVKQWYRLLRTTSVSFADCPEAFYNHNT